MDSFDDVYKRWILLPFTLLVYNKRAPIVLDPRALSNRRQIRLQLYSQLLLLFFELRSVKVGK